MPSARASPAGASPLDKLAHAFDHVGEMLPRLERKDFLARRRDESLKHSYVASSAITARSEQLSLGKAGNTALRS